MNKSFGPKPQIIKASSRPFPKLFLIKTGPVKIWKGSTAAMHHISRYFEGSLSSLKKPFSLP